MENKRVAVTGGNGFLGHHLVPLLQKAYSTVVIIKHKDYDLLREDRVKAMYRTIKPDIVIHLAANVGGIQYNDLYPATLFYENLQMGINVIHEGMVYGKLKKLLCLGSICQYAKIPPHIPFQEDDEWYSAPDSSNLPYGVAKRSLEVMCQAYRKQYGMNNIFLMPVNLYGSEDCYNNEQGHVIPMLIRRFIEAKEQNEPKVVIWGSGNQTREFLYAGDCAKMIVTAIESYNDSFPINLGSGRETPIRELAETISKLTGYKGKIEWDESKPDGQPRRYLDIKRSIMYLGFQPDKAVSLEEGLRKTIDWYLENRGNL